MDILPKRTSALKLKKVSVRDLEQLTTWLGRLSRNELGPIVADWLIAGCATGLRPREWADARLIAGHLRVRNAKFSEELGRSNGEYRHLDLSELSVVEMRAVTRMATVGAGWETEGRFDEMQKRCASVLYAATNRLWPKARKAISLYSCRHQAVSNLKATSSHAETSATVGHATTRAAQERYGRKRNAWSDGDLRVARPIAEEVATVRPGRIPFWEQRVAPVEEIVVGSSPTF
jgi:hypothetical protein